MERISVGYVTFHHRQRLCARRRWLRDQSRSRLYGNKGAPMLERPHAFDPDSTNLILSRAEADEMRCSLWETIAIARERIAQSRELLAQVDKVLARK